MKTHPAIAYWVAVPVAALLLMAAQTAMVCFYADADLLPAAIDSAGSIGWLLVLGYLAWFVVGIVSLSGAEVIALPVGVLLWLGGSFMVCDILTGIIGISYIDFAPTIPFRLLFGIPAWVAIFLWYRLAIAKEEKVETEMAMHRSEDRQEEPPIDRITVKDGSKIHLIKTDEIVYIQACGDYAMLITPSGEYLKEQTMKYFETHLPAKLFVRVHRSIIVNVTQISRVELFGKETYQLLLKNGVKLRVSLSGYRLLKERLGI